MRISKIFENTFLKRDGLYFNLHHLKEYPSTSLLSPYPITSLGIGALWFSGFGQVFSRVLASVFCFVFAGCENTSQLGSLTVVSEGWLIRPGSPSKYLKRQLTQVAPDAISAADKEVFAAYEESGPSVWSTSWTSKLDFTGVAWDNAKAGTLIHPQFVVFASHFARRKGESLTFHDRAGRPVKRKIARRAMIHRIKDPDFTVAMLDQPVPPTVTHYPILPVGHDYRVLNGAPLLVTDKERKVHLFRINRVSRTGYEQIGARPALGHEYGSGLAERLEKGDSGHPAFVLVNGRLVLASTLKGGGWATTGPFFGGSKIQAALQQAIKRLAGSSTG